MATVGKSWSNGPLAVTRAPRGPTKASAFAVRCRLQSSVPGLNFPLTKTVALRGISTQAPPGRSGPRDIQLGSRTALQNSRGEWITGPPAVRSRQRPEGLPNLSREGPSEGKGNAMAKRSIRGLLDADANGRFGLLEHPYGSHMWYLPEAKALYDDSWFWTCFSNGRRRKWTSLVHIRYRERSRVSVGYVCGIR